MIPAKISKRRRIFQRWATKLRGEAHQSRVQRVLRAQPRRRRLLGGRHREQRAARLHLRALLQNCGDYCLSTAADFCSEEHVFAATIAFSKRKGNFRRRPRATLRRHRHRDVLKMLPKYCSISAVSASILRGSMHFTACLRSMRVLKNIWLKFQKVGEVGEMVKSVKLASCKNWQTSADVLHMLLHNY